MKRPDFYTYDPAVNAMACARLSVTARGVDAVLGDVAWVTGFATCSVSLEDAARHCADVPDLDAVISALVTAGRWRREGTRLVSLFLLERQAECAAFRAKKVAAGRKGGTVTQEQKRGPGRQRGPQLVPPQEVGSTAKQSLAPASAGEHRPAEPSTPKPVQNSSSVLPLSEVGTELPQDRARTTPVPQAAPAASHAGGASVAAPAFEEDQPPPPPDPTMAPRWGFDPNDQTLQRLSALLERVSTTPPTSRLRIA